MESQEWIRIWRKQGERWHSGGITSSEWQFLIWKVQKFDPDDRKTRLKLVEIVSLGSMIMMYNHDVHVHVGVRIQVANQFLRDCVTTRAAWRHIAKNSKLSVM